MSRRGLLGATFTSVAAAWMGPRLASASDLGSAERLRRLYSNRFVFGADGEPRITIGLMQGQRTVRIGCEAGLLVALSGEDTTVLEAGSRWTVRIGRSTPGSVRHSLVLASLPAYDAAAIDAKAKAFRARGLDVDLHEVGAAFGVRGRSLDARRILLTTGTFGSPSDAHDVARLLERDLGITPRTHPVIDRRASGIVIGTDAASGATLRAEGVLWFRPRDGKTPIVIEDVASGGIHGHGERSTRAYRGEVYVAVDKDGALAVVNRVRETDLLAGLVPAEIFPSAPFEALCAQAIAARGQLVAKAGTRHLADPYLLCAHQHCQVYAGVVREDPRATRAVEHTRGRLLLRPERDVLVDTVYSANCGGHTEDNDAVWPAPADPRLRGKPDPRLAARFPAGIGEDNLHAFLTDASPAFSRPPDGRHAESYRWRAEVDLAQVSRRLAARGEAVGRIREVRIASRGRSGRATTLIVVGTRGTRTIHGELVIRRLLGGLRSSLFAIADLDTARGTMNLVGAGHGHGVGMCQHGAMGMARAGWSHARILGHYYAAPRLVRLW
ncbi:MAG: SpoIID/LytB domain-containing protein [Deltaproteobacteria bacterium]|nr:MAG: SpoIID/LytB domain-containing protein [Deltaproteobacteria bacterium]